MTTTPIHLPPIHIIVGAGQAGAHAAIAMREAGFAGRIVLVGDEPHHPYERPPLSKEFLTADTETPPALFHAVTRYAERDIELLLGSPVVAIDPAARRVSLQTGESLPYDRLLLTTGSRARHLAIPGGDDLLYLRTLDDARHIRLRLAPGLRLVCIGAGVIGLEIASSARQRGCEVTVLEAAPGAMARMLTPDMADYMVRLHRGHGVTLHFNAAISAIAEKKVICADRAIPADSVIAGIGVIRNTELAAAAGIAVDGGITVDEFGRTNLSGIYAAGDVAAFWHPLLHRRLRLESWRHAQNHGIAVGRVMAGVEQPYDDIPWFWSDQHGVNLQVAGLPDQANRTVLRGDETAPSFAAFHLDTENHVVGATGINAPREVRAAQAMIRAGKPVDPAAVADPRVQLQRLVAATR
jgi:3-phenylpropionate/trans-cinnamate dioxygenase ferredoxin reductase subunit